MKRVTAEKKLVPRIMRSTGSLQSELAAGSSGATLSFTAIGAFSNHHARRSVRPDSTKIESR
jgi:hypothetical protein